MFANKNLQNAIYGVHVIILLMLGEDNSEFNAIVIEIVAFQFKLKNVCARKTNKRERKKCAKS